MNMHRSFSGEYVSNNHLFQITDEDRSRCTCEQLATRTGTAGLVHAKELRRSTELSNTRGAHRPCWATSCVRACLQTHSAPETARSSSSWSKAHRLLLRYPESPPPLSGHWYTVIGIRMNAGYAGKTVRSLENACHTW